MSHIISGDEATRLQALKALDLMDTPFEREYDELAQLAAISCGTPISLMTLLDERRQWFKARVGLEASETPVEISFCTHAIRTPKQMMIVEDTWKDERFVNNPLVTGDLGIRFYAGMPIQTPDGSAMGTLCVIDRVPRQLTEIQTMTLRVLANQIQSQLELRIQRNVLQEALQEKEAVAARLRASEELFREFMNASPYLTFIKDEHFRYVFYNKRYADLNGISMDWLLGKQADELHPPEVASIIRALDLRALDASEIIEVEDAVPRRNGNIEHWRSLRFQCHDSEGKVMLAGIARDITQDKQRDQAIRQYQEQLEEANRLLSQLAVTDALTGLKNRRSFDDRLEVDFSMACRRGRTLSVALLDIDNFKDRNDRSGHAAGDTALRQLGKVLSETIRLTDEAVRYGGEEFAVLLPETDSAAAVLWAERLHAAIRAFPWPGEPITVSIGVAALDPYVQNGQDLVELADQALYTAKRSGKNRTVAYQRPELITSEKSSGNPLP